MFIDMTLKITPKMVKDAQGNEKKALVGHLGTHFDVMDKEFPLELFLTSARWLTGILGNQISGWRW